MQVVLLVIVCALCAQFEEPTASVSLSLLEEEMVRTKANHAAARKGEVSSAVVSGVGIRDTEVGQRSLNSQQAAIRCWLKNCF